MVHLCCMERRCCRWALTLVCNDDDRQVGPMRARKDFKTTTKILTSLRQEQGRQNSFIPKNERVRQRNFSEALRTELEWQSPNWKNLLGRNLLPLHHPHNNGGNTNIKTLNGANTKTLNGEITSGGKSDGCSVDFCVTDFAYRHWRMSCSRRSVEDRKNTSSHAHFSQSCQCRAHLSTFDLSHARSRHDWDVLHVCAPLKSSTLTTCVIDNFSTYLTHFRHFVPRHLRRHRTHCLWLESGDPPVLLRQEDCSLAIWLNQLLPQVISPRPASTSTVNTLRSTTPRGKTASTSRTTTLPLQPQPPITPTVFISKRQPTVARSEHQASVVNPWLGADTWSSTRKLMRGNESLSSVEGTLSRGKRDQDLEGLQTLSERRNLHVYLEQKAEWAVQGECQAQKKTIWGWSTNLTKRNWEQRCSDTALYETDRELASQRLELCEANQWADQAQREKINLCGGLEMRNRRFQESPSTWRTTWRTLSQPPRILTIFLTPIRGKQQPAFGSKHGSNVVEFSFSPQHRWTGARQQSCCTCWRIWVQREKTSRFKKCANFVGQAKFP